jgi:hypothetical protein
VLTGALRKMAMRKKGRSDKSPARKGAVVTKHVSGVSNSWIARDLEISHPTVIRILSENKIDSFVQQGRSGLYELFPLRRNAEVESMRS